MSAKKADFQPPMRAKTDVYFCGITRGWLLHVPGPVWHASTALSLWFSVRHSPNAFDFSRQEWLPLLARGVAAASSFARHGDAPPTALRGAMLERCMSQCGFAGLFWDADGLTGVPAAPSPDDG